MQPSEEMVHRLHGSLVVSTNGCQNRGNGSKWVWSELNIHHGNGMAKMEEQWQVMKNNDM